MPRLRTRPSIFTAKSSLSTTNGVSKNISNSTLFSRNTSNAAFELDSYRSGIKSTQQLSIDFSKFENHAFFAPARAKIDLAAYKIFNQFPYTGSLSDVDLFIQQMTGFERFIYDNTPKNVGYLNFSGSAAPGGGSYITVSPIAGNNFSQAPGATGQNALLLSDSLFEIETHVFIPTITNNVQVIAQRLSSDAGFTLALDNSSDTTQCNIMFLVSSASEAYVIASGSIQKGRFNHLRACLSTQDSGKIAAVYVNGSLIASSSDIQDFGDLTFTTQNMFIGSGSYHSIIDYAISPQTTFSGALDEFRFFVGERTQADINDYAYHQKYATDQLRLRFGFDEPYGSYDYDDVALDSSGNALHSYIQNFTSSLRLTSSLAQPMTYQDYYYNPVLFPSDDAVNNYFYDLITSASDYDKDNPNIILSLVPPHYLDESALANGLNKFDSGLGVMPAIDTIPGTGRIAQTSSLVRLLCTVSITLDEIKQFADSMSKILAIELDSDEDVSDQMLPFVADYFGVELPNFFAKSSTDQFIFGQNVAEDQVTSYTLKDLRNTLWRRLLANMPNVNVTKGTGAAVRSIFLSSGIVPENFFEIRELGMAGETRLVDKREQTLEVMSVLDFSASLNSPVGSAVPMGFKNDSPRLVGSYLSASRVETGYPYPVGTFTDKTQYSPHGISNNVSDGLLTSGSFTLEAAYVFDTTKSHPAQQSLIRLETTSSAGKNPVLMNVVYNNVMKNLSCSLCVDAVNTTNPNVLKLVLSGVDLFDGNRWVVGVERTRADAFNIRSGSNYSVRCARQAGNTVTLFTTSSYFLETPNASSNALSNISTQNTSGCFIVVGSQSLDAPASGLNGFVNEFGSIASMFTGKISGVRFWSTDVGQPAFIEHARNPYNIGTRNPELGLGFDLVQTGAFQRLRVDASCDQATTTADIAGNIRIFDFSQNLSHISGSGFEAGKTVIKPYRQFINRLAPRFDLQQSSNKVRVRGLDVVEPTDPQYTVTGPAYEIYSVDSIIDDVRYSIEHSVVKALDQDIVATIGDMQYLDNVLGSNADMFSDTYSNFVHLNDVYFNRLTDKVDLMRTYQVFRWVDTALSQMISAALPKRTRFSGMNYVIEPHILERGKVKYYSEEMAVATTGASVTTNISRVDDVAGSVK